MLDKSEIERVTRSRGVRSELLLLLACGVLSSTLAACESGVGDPCVPEEEYLETFSGFSAEEVVAETRSLQCETRVCLVNHFQGRVSCPYGQTAQQTASGPRCVVPGGVTPVQEEVSPQLLARRADDAVYCSCRCDGPDKNARYCECPTGFSCEQVIPKLGIGKEQLAGSYCIREGTRYNRSGTNFAEVCDPSRKNCE
jgi:hypothetical protein